MYVPFYCHVRHFLDLKTQHGCITNEKLGRSVGVGLKIVIDITNSGTTEIDSSGSQSYHPMTQNHLSEDFLYICTYFSPGT